MKNSTEHTKQVQKSLESLIEELRNLAKGLGNWPDYNDGVFYHRPTAKLQDPYLRDEYLIKLCKGKRVLHFGFADSPFTQERIKNGQLLHLSIKKVASELWGADIDNDSINKYREMTQDVKNWALDICAPLDEGNKYNKNFDIVFFGEILEHLLNPGEALKNLHKLCEINGAKLVVTTPNAFTSVGFLTALLGNEMVHPEHYYYYSPVTLKRLLSDCGFKEIKISFYAGTNTKDSPGLTFPGLIAVCKA